MLSVVLITILKRSSNCLLYTKM